MEEISEDEEEFQVDNDGDDEPLPKRRKSTNQSISRKVSAAKVIPSKPVPVSRKMSSAAQPPVLVDHANRIGASTFRPTTPDLKFLVKEEKVAWGAKLPPTPQSGPSLLNLVDEKVVRAEHKLGFGSARNNSNQGQPPSVSQTTSSTTILPSIEHDDGAEDEDEAISDARSNTTSTISVTSNHQHESIYSIPKALQIRPPLPDQEEVNATESCVVQ